MKTQAVIDHIVHWLNTYCENAGMNGFVVGVSGGIDSAVTSCLCVRTGKKVLLLNMPIHQNPQQVSLSTRHIDALCRQRPNAACMNIDLTPPFKALGNALPNDIQDPHTMANTRSRLRMLTLYAVATHHRLLVAGTGNKVEDFGIGFYTKYGDGGVDLSPIADLTKTEVYALGAHMGVLQDILTAAPTDGLWEDSRTDEDQIGATYPELEWAMDCKAGRVSCPRPTPRQKEVLAVYEKFHTANRHKMHPIPVCAIPSTLKEQDVRVDEPADSKQ